MIRAFLATALLAHAASAVAIEYTEMSPKSSVSFVYRQMNVPMEGAFKRLSGSLKIDPDKPASSFVKLDIDVGSIETGAADADEEVRGKAWFNVAAHPRASFVSSAIVAKGGRRLEVTGKLTLKGRTKEITAPVEFKPQGMSGAFEGTLTIKRSDFAIGEGAWADYATIANEVQIRFQIVATANPPKK